MFFPTASKEFQGVAAIFVLYMSSPSEMINELAWMVEGGAFVILVDNTPGVEEGTRNFNNVVHCCMGRNAGVAAALNKGLELCKALDARYIFTFDQDSRFNADLLRGLLAQYKIQRQAFNGPLALGPFPVNKLTGASYLRRSDRVRLWLKKWLGLKNESSLLPVRELITSGLLADDVTYSLVGNYNDALFIDFVDHEWTWRCSRQGGRCFVAMDVKMAHMIGSGDIPYTGGMRLGSPSRIFYLFRNGIFLALSGKMPVYDAIKFIALMPTKFFVFGILRDRRLRWLNMLQGLKAGVNSAFHGKIL